jgi:hypothetical protein
MTSKKDKDLASYIQTIIESHLLETMTWGYEDPKPIKDGLKFKVTGLKHQGYVKILYHEGKDQFQIQLFSKKHVLKDSIEDVYIDQLVQVINQSVERVPNYGEVVRKMYGLPPMKDKIDRDLK